MEIRTLDAPERDTWLDLLDGWELPDGWSGRDFFRRWIEHDPSWSDDNVWVAAEGDRLLSSVQIFPRELRVHDHPVPAGGIGSVYTEPSHRNQGLAGQLLERAVVDMRERGMELSLLFATRFDFYGAHGWESWKNQRAWMRRAEGPRGEVPADPTLEILRFDEARDLSALTEIQAEYSRSRSGTVIRDEALWDASFDLAGNPDEELLVARRGDELLAHLRLTRMFDKLIVTEMSRGDDPEPLAAMIDAQLSPREHDVLCADGQASETLREALLLPCFDDLLLTVSLEQRGISAQVVDDPQNMLQCLNADALGARLDVSVHSDETPNEFLQRVLSPESFVFWPADRF